MHKNTTVFFSILGIILLSFLVVWKPFLAVGLVIGLLFVIIAYLWPHIGIFILIGYVPLVDLISYKLATPEYLIFFRFSTEIAAGIIVLILILKKVMAREKLRLSREFVWLILFLAAAALSSLLNRVDSEHFLFGLTVLLRYFLIFLAALNIEWKSKLLKQLLIVILIVGSVQILISFGQVILGEWFKNIFIFDTKLSFTTDAIFSLERQALDKAWVFGTFPRYNLLGGFLMLTACLSIAALLITCSQNLRKALVAYNFLAVIVIILSNSRNSWVGTFLAMVTVLLILKKHKVMVGLIFGILLSTLMLVTFSKPVSLAISESSGATPTERFLGVFSGEYISKSLQNDRLFLITKASQQIVANAAWLGVGMGQAWSAQEAAFGDFKYSLLLGLPVESWYYLGDVGWIALFSQVGFIGLFLFMALLVSLLSTIRGYINKTDGIEKIYLVGFVAMWVVMMVTNIWSFNLTYRSTSFYFWLIAGVALSITYRYKEDMQSERRKALR